MKLHEVLKLEQHGRFKDALDILENTLLDDMNEGHLLKARYLGILGKQEEATKIVNQVLTRKNDTGDLTITLGSFVIIAEQAIVNGELDKTFEYTRKANKLLDQRKNEEELKNNIWYGRLLLLQATLFEKLSKLDEAMRYCVNSLKVFKKLENNREIANATDEMGQIYHIRGELDKALTKYNESLNIRISLDNKYDITKSLNHLGVIYAQQGNFDKALSNFKESSVYSEQLNNQNELCKIYNNIGNLHKIKGEHREALAYYSKSIEYAIQLGNKESLARAYMNVGVIQMENGELEDALLTYNEAKPLVEELGHKKEIGLLYNNLGSIHKKRGDLDKAIEYYKKSLKLKEEINNKREIAATLHNIGVIYFQKGELNLALEKFQESLQLRSKDGTKFDLAWDLQYIGLIYFEQRKNTEAIKYLTECLIIRKKSGNQILLSEILYYLIAAHLNMNDEKKVQKYLKDLKQINKKVDNKTIKIRLKLVEAMILQNSSRLSKQAEAQELFEEVLEEDLIDKEFTIFAMLNLCEFLLMEVRTTGEYAILDEINSILDKLYEIATNQESHPLLIELLIMQSKLSKLDYNFTEAISFLNQALDIAEDKGLRQAKLKVTMMKKQLENDWEDMKIGVSRVSLNQRIDQLEIEGYLKEVARIVSLNSKYKDNTLLTSYENLSKTNMDYATLILMDKDLPEQVKRYIHFVDISTKDIQISISTFILLDKLESNSYPLSVESIDLWKLFKDRLQFKLEKLEEKEIEILIDRPESNYEINSDRYLLSRVFDNVMQNLEKFTPSVGDVEIIVQEIEDFWLIKIYNDSPVIPEEEQQKLFEKYTQYEIIKNTYKYGVGLGLAYIRSALKFIQGDITLYSPARNKSSGFEVELKINKDTKNTKNIR